MLLAEKVSQPHIDPTPEEDTLIEIVEQSSISDKLGIMGSTLCLIHCLVLPFLLPLITSTNSNTHTYGFDSWFHGIIFPALLLFAVSAFSRGYKIHHSKQILILGIGGIFIISMGLISEYIPRNGILSPESITSSGSILLVVAHIFNILKIRTTKPHIHSASCGCSSISNNSKKVIQLKKSNG